MRDTMAENSGMQGSGGNLSKNLPITERGDGKGRLGKRAEKRMIALYP